MPNNASAAKRDRQNEKRRVANKARTTELKTIQKQFLRAVHDGKQDEAAASFQRFTKRIDQAAANNVVHKNNASRHKSRLALRLKAMASA
jgi:small subunit ribosomal protein S20